MNETLVTMSGFVASAPKLVRTKSGRFVTNMRIGVTPRLHDRETGQWSDGNTSYMTVTCWRSLATNVAACLRKGDPIVVKGRMRVRHYDDKEGNQRTVVEVDASTLGHDLTRGVAHFLRTKRLPGDARAMAESQYGARAGTGGHADPGWPAGVRDEVHVRPENIPGEDFSVADLFDDAEVETSARTLAADDGEPRSSGIGADATRGGEPADAADADVSDARTGARQAGQAA